MGIRKRVAVGISGLAFAGATALTLGAATPASAQTLTTAPNHAVVGQSTHKHHWRSESWTYESWERWSCGCCCCC